MRSDWASREAWSHILAVLTPPNALAIEISLRYGLRIGDVLALKTDDVRKGRFTIKEQKTGKSRRIELCEYIQLELLNQSNRIWAFPGRCDPKKHRTRQAVYNDVIRAVRAFRLRDNITPHSSRKTFAVALYNKYGDMTKVQQRLNHTDIETTMIYALADHYARSARAKRGH